MNNKKTFTLIEMLIVIVIIGILAAALVPRLQSIQSRARNTQRKTAVSQITNGVRIYHMDNSSFPSHLWVLVTSSIMTSIPKDPQFATNELCLSPFHGTWSTYWVSSGFYSYGGNQLGQLAYNGYAYASNNTENAAWVGAKMEDDGSVNSYSPTNECTWISNSARANSNMVAWTNLKAKVAWPLTYQWAMYVEIVQ